MGKTDRMGKVEMHQISLPLKILMSHKQTDDM